MSGEQKRHHVVPEFYLRFANEKERITVVRRGARPHTTHVRNAGVVGKFNTVTDPGGNPSLVVENMFADFEGLAKPIIERIAETGHIPMHEPRSLVAQYMALQYTRTPEWRDVANIEAEIRAKTLMSAHTDASLRRMLRAMHGREPEMAHLALVILRDSGAVQRLRIRRLGDGDTHRRILHIEDSDLPIELRGRLDAMELATERGRELR